MNTALANHDLISIAEAAERFGVHRRTLERWIGAGQLAAVVSETDRRKRLVDPAAIEVLMQEAQDRHQAPSLTSTQRAIVRQPEHAAPAQPDPIGVPMLPDDDRAVIDNALQIVYSHHHRVAAQLSTDAFRPLTLEQLRNGPLGHDLVLLARVAHGQIRLPKEQTLDAIDSVLQLLF